MKYEISFGVIPLIKKKGEWHVLLINHKKGGHWAFPKGHGEKGEQPIETAARELHEETGLRIKHLLKEETLKETYQFYLGGQHIYKTVIYFLAEVKGILKLQTEEIWDAKWVKLSEAENVVTFTEAKKILQKTLTIIAR